MNYSQNQFLLLKFMDFYLYLQFKHRLLSLILHNSLLYFKFISHYFLSNLLHNSSHYYFKLKVIQFTIYYKVQLNLKLFQFAIQNYDYKLSSGIRFLRYQNANNHPHSLRLLYFDLYTYSNI